MKNFTKKLTLVVAFASCTLILHAKKVKTANPQKTLFAFFDAQRELLPVTLSTITTAPIELSIQDETPTWAQPNCLDTSLYYYTITITNNSDQTVRLDIETLKGLGLQNPYRMWLYDYPQLKYSFIMEFESLKNISSTHPYNENNDDVKDPFKPNPKILPHMAFIEEFWKNFLPYDNNFIYAQISPKNSLLIRFAVEKPLENILFDTTQNGNFYYISLLKQ